MVWQSVVSQTLRLLYSCLIIANLRADLDTLLLFNSQFYPLEGFHKVFLII